MTESMTESAVENSKPKLIPASPSAKAMKAKKSKAAKKAKESLAALAALAAKHRDEKNTTATTPEPAVQEKPVVVAGPPQSRIQDIVNELVWQYGSNVMNRRDCDGLWQVAGIKKEDITEGMVGRAIRWCREELSKVGKEHNGKADKAFDVVIEGDPETDPQAVVAAKEPVKEEKPAEKPTKQGKKALKEAKPVTTTSEKSTRPRTKGVMLLGHPLSSVVRWMGWKGFSIESANKVLVNHGIAAPVTSIRTYLCDGKREDQKYGKRAELTKEQEEGLLKFKV